MAATPGNENTKDMDHLNHFIQSIAWWKLVPSGLDGMKDLIIDAGADTTVTYVASSCSRDGSFLVAYLPPARTGSITVDMSALKNKAYGYWFDPTSGKYTVIEGSPFKNKGTLPFTPTGVNSNNENDWVLVLTINKRP